MKNVFNFIKKVFKFSNSKKDLDYFKKKMKEDERFSYEEERYTCFNCGHSLYGGKSMITSNIITDNGDSKSFGYCEICGYVTTFINGRTERSKDSIGEIELARSLFKDIGENPKGYSYISGGSVYNFDEDIDYEVENETIDNCDIDEECEYEKIKRKNNKVINLDDYR